MGLEAWQLAELTLYNCIKGSLSKGARKLNVFRKLSAEAGIVRYKIWVC